MDVQEGKSDQKDRQTERTCRYCGEKYFPKKRGRLSNGFCCKNCADSYRIKHKPPKYHKTCEFCGKEYDTNSKDQRFCSRECSVGSRRGRTVYKKNCQFCGKEFETIYPKYKFCTAACASRYYAELNRKEYFCEYCGKPRYSDHPNGHRYCSRECAVKAQKEKYAAEKAQKMAEEKEKIRRQRWGVCTNCKKIFLRQNPKQKPLQKQCSDACQYAYYKQRQRERYAENYEPRIFYCAECGKRVQTTLKDNRSVYCSDRCANRVRQRESKKRRAEQMEQAFVEKVDPEEVYRRADGVCEICGLPVPHTWESENEWAATVDHIQPISQGGLHKESNVQLAHRLCNSLKGIEAEVYKVDWEQMVKDDPDRWGKRLDELWKQLETEDELAVLPPPQNQIAV